MADDRAALKALQSMPNIGPAMARDLVSMGFRTPEELRGQEPMELYRRLEQITGSRQDPCVLDTFMSAVHYAETGERRPWWSFTAERKEILKRQA
ncbi:helix-hairpin-helix domain-containing protein [Fimbriimonas ginsengisoli]|uniref:Putative mitomycin resistance protein n=1 Tax=Fimbriimonas ginsengisoli Gsoil 348 TaxID=661478 RepID=A0A068NXM6_FIMGI|nr:helix-hairpin-helix domain-containing protein [Fimbriimonas ginsengisoli]AIE86394.1 putative mitomycin resistance protein [Fimbriimonas ginsengisoli Gsoil 348]